MFSSIHRWLLPPFRDQLTVIEGHFCCRNFSLSDLCPCLSPSLGVHGSLFACYSFPTKENRDKAIAFLLPFQDLHPLSDHCRFIVSLERRSHFPPFVFRCSPRFLMSKIYQNEFIILPEFETL